MAFWVAAFLPLFYVPPFATGLVGPADEVVLGPVTANVLASLLGARLEESDARHLLGYRRVTDAESRRRTNAFPRPRRSSPQ